MIEVDKAMKLPTDEVFKRRMEALEKLEPNTFRVVAYTRHDKGPRVAGSTHVVITPIDRKPDRSVCLLVVTEVELGKIEPMSLASYDPDAQDNFILFFPVDDDDEAHYRVFLSALWHKVYGASVIVPGDNDMVRKVAYLAVQSALELQVVTGLGHSQNAPVRAARRILVEHGIKPKRRIRDLVMQFYEWRKTVDPLAKVPNLKGAK